ncbi:DUF7573 domain-containing protein [Halobellus rubicundus]|uniref:DUF7573 domain-containing protein n=1 Tax=Halobellus rubicundus TaxID=2996466 RepID=A0ABD5M7P7_9EURY
MGRDRSLDEFVGGGSDGAETDSDGDDHDAGVDVDADSDSDPDVDESADSDPGIDTDAESNSVPDVDADIESDADSDESGHPDPQDVEPAAATYRWEPDGAECPACGATVERLWSGEDGKGQVCADCKDW